MKIAFDRYLDDLESRIDGQAEQAILDGWKDFSNGRMAPGKTARDIPGRTPAPSAIEWPDITVNESLESVDAMLYSQLKSCSGMLSGDGNTVLWMRSNYGVGTIPSILGCPIFIMPEETNCLPNVRNLEGGNDAIRRLLDNWPTDMTMGWGPQVFEIGSRFADIRRRYPKIARYVYIDHPDGQGPIDLCELLWGSEMFLAFYDEPEMLGELVGRVTDFYAEFMDRWFALVPGMDGYHPYFSRVHRGGITIRNDSLMNLPPDIYEAYVFPYDQKLFDRYGGGMVHFCGTGTHFIEKMSMTRGLYAIDMSQPHLNDMDHILTHTVDKGINLYTSQGDWLSTVDASAHDMARISM